MREITNHPVHILNINGNFSTSSFIPFCSFGEVLIGHKIDRFDMPVCNIFKPKRQYDQLCYETDLQELKHNNNEVLMKQLEIGLTLILDYNEERQMNLAFDNNDDNSVSLYLNTISKYNDLKGLIV